MTDSLLIILPDFLIILLVMPLARRFGYAIAGKGGTTAQTLGSMVTLPAWITMILADLAG